MKNSHIHKVRPGEIIPLPMIESMLKSFSTSWSLGFEDGFALPFDERLLRVTLVVTAPDLTQSRMASDIPITQALSVLQSFWGDSLEAVSDSNVYGFYFRNKETRETVEIR